MKNLIYQWNEIDSYLYRTVGNDASISRFYSDADNLVIATNQEKRNEVKTAIEGLGWKLYDVGANKDLLMMTFK